MKIDRSDAADARRLRWLIDGGENFLEENALEIDSPDDARRLIDQAVLKELAAGDLKTLAALVERDAVDPDMRDKAESMRLLQLGVDLKSHRIGPGHLAPFEFVKEGQPLEVGEFLATVVLIEQDSGRIVARGRGGRAAEYHLAITADGGLHCHTEVR